MFYFIQGNFLNNKLFQIMNYFALQICSIYRTHYQQYNNNLSTFIIMFVKKETLQEVQLNRPYSFNNPLNEQLFKVKALNHDFFLLVRDQHYEQAYALGMKILKADPQNSAIERFCYFISNNQDQLKKMVEEEKQYTDGSQQGSEYSQEEDQDSEEQQQQKQSVSCSSRSRESSISSLSSKSSASMSGKKCSEQKIPSKKSVQQKENIHKWQHNCKNKDCPNKNKNHKCK